MRYRNMGDSDLNVSVIGFGAWEVGGQYGSFSEQEFIEAVQRALDLGVTLFDTALGYGAGRSEALLGRALHPPRARNPDPGAFLPVGGYVIQGFAFDRAAVGNTEGAGISSIEVFLDDPNQGGQILGSTGMNATGEEAGSVFAMPSTRQRQATRRSDEAVPVRWACVRPGSQNWSAAETLRLRRMRTT